MVTSCESWVLCGHENVSLNTTIHILWSDLHHMNSHLVTSQCQFAWDRNIVMFFCLKYAVYEVILRVQVGPYHKILELKLASMYRYFTTLLNLNNICKDCNRCAFYTNSIHSQFLLSLCYQDHCKYICCSYLRGERSNKGGLLIQNEALGVKS